MNVPHRRIVWLTLLLCLALAVMLTGCRRNSVVASDEEDTIAAEFPPHPEATMIEIEEVEDSDLPFAGSNATAALYVVDDKGMVTASHYSSSTVYHGWAFSGGGGTEYILSDVFAKDMRTVQVTFISGRVLNHYFDEISSISIPPFSVDDLSVDDGGTIVYTRIATCEEAEIGECIWKQQQQPGLHVPLPGESPKSTPTAG